MARWKNTYILRAITSNELRHVPYIFDGQCIIDITSFATFRNIQLCYGDPDSHCVTAAAPPPRRAVSLFFAEVCNVHDAPLSDKMDGLYGAHTFTLAYPARRVQGRLHCMEA